MQMKSVTIVFSRRVCAELFAYAGLPGREPREGSNGRHLNSPDKRP